MRYLFVVETPFQLLCAYEAHCILVPEKSTWILRFNGEAENDSQLQALANKLHLKYKTVTVRNHMRYFDFFIAAFKILCFKKGKRNILVSGSYFSNFIFFTAKIIRPDSVYYVDDGVATFLAQTKMKEKGESNTIVTCFDVTKTTAEQHIHTHAFEASLKYFDSTSPAKKKAASVFVGQKLIEAGFVDKECYLKAVGNGVMQSNDRMLYIPHRGESDDTVDSVALIEGVTIMRCDTCIEVFLLENGYLPEKILSFFSSALLTLSAIYPDAGIYSYAAKKQLKEAPHKNEISQAIESIPNVEIICL